jgi:hypothetical protein
MPESNTVEIEAGGETVTVDAHPGHRPGRGRPAPAPDVRVRSTAEDAIRVLGGDPEALRRAEVDGDAGALARLAASRRPG